MSMEMKDLKNKKGKVIVMTDEFNLRNSDKLPQLYDQLEKELKDIEELIEKYLKS